MRAFRSIIAAFVALAIFAACGGSGDDADSSASDQAPTTAGQQDSDTTSGTPEVSTTEPAEEPTQAPSNECPSLEEVEQAFGFASGVLTYEASDPDPLAVYDCTAEMPDGFWNGTFHVADYGSEADAFWDANQAAFDDCSDGCSEEFGDYGEAYEKFEDRNGTLLAYRVADRETDSGTNIIAFSRSGSIICTVIVLGLVDGAYPSAEQQTGASVSMSRQECGV
jgi:hypothetical protein